MTSLLPVKWAFGLALRKLVREDGTEAFLHSPEISDFPRQPRTLVDSDVLGFSPASCSVLINPIFARTPKTTFSRLNAATIYGPSWSVRRHGRSSSVGPAVFLGSPPTLNTLGPSWSVRRHDRSSQCGTCGFPGLTANPQHNFGPSWSVRLHGRSSQRGTRGFPGLTANPHTFGPPGVCGSMAAPRSVGPAVFLGSPPTHNTLGPSWSVRLLAAPPVWDLRFTRAQHLKRLEHQTSAVDVNLNQGFVPRSYPRWGNGHSRAQ